MTAHFLFWRISVVASYMLLILVLGGVGALFASALRSFLTQPTTESLKHSATMTLSEKLDLWFYVFLGTCIRLYVKTAQWLGSFIVVLYIISALGFLISFSLKHWRQIWGV